MSEPQSNHPPRRRNADYRWTRPKVAAFLHALAATGSVAGAAARVGMSRQSCYRLRARLGKGFGAVWDEGLALAHVRRLAQGDSPEPKVTPGGAR